MQILKVIVGSRAHGLSSEDSDYDYRSVFVNPTSQILSLGPKPKDTEWVEADKAKGEKDDVTGWEIGHFLHLAVQGNPTILEAFVAPMADTGSEPDGLFLRAMFPYVWHPQRVRDAFLGYGENQQRKMLADKDGKWRKFAQAWIRVLWQAEQLLLTGTLPINFRDTEFYGFLAALRDQTTVIKPGFVVDEALSLHERVKSAAGRCTHEPDLAKVNEFLLDIRRRYW